MVNSLFDRSELTALIISIAIESLVVGVWSKIKRLEWRSLVLVATGSTLFTHPILWQLVKELSSHFNFNILILLLECLVTTIEGLMYQWAMGYSWRSSLTISFAANLASYTFGLLIYKL
jgi:hypothetical protein